ncbi:conserved hypothetical protein [Ferrimonas balearica DSM 9799]|uniref:Lipoprotein n=1 Tax=Ferrimonas balearica (strain DSM 9799 / CCM 4581 / KCTC 23876 / PAT) TaxID=550540 RepID=E1SPX4_FERBD|nr:hypothetical protein [Ferrimonas balearica]MBY6016250.1 hypothetical protein [Halomonas denitrificans]ADN75769.1 conserved hypothetical protein [Ferrimonas balearica DSM 9799]MBW3138671.1 hypothetical protein [Ferrimonas balearica]MBY5979465.1 hypothetical protein [Ferrimonas balearica]MBY6095481.1 hypothetical protein [Ferrimonas balearica]
MKRTNTTRSALLLLAALGLAACGSDSDDNTVTPEPPQPEPDSISINDTATLDLAITQFDGPGGSVSFTLTGDDKLPVTGANAFQALFMGYPAAGPTSVKYGLTWHQSTQLDCTDPSGHCDAVLTETAAGEYTLRATGLDWRNEVEDFRAALSIAGAQVTTDIIWTD